MAASLKVSELSGLTSLASSDLLLISDVDVSASKKISFLDLQSSISLANLGSRALNDLSDLSVGSPSSGQFLQWNGSAWVPATPAYSTQASLGVDHLITLSGVADGSDHLGTFTGVTISDSRTVKQALQELETEIEANGTNKADATTVTEIDGNVNDLITLSGVAENASHLGTFTGSTIADNKTVKEALQALETEIEDGATAAEVLEIDSNVDDLTTAVGISENTTHLGTFSGSTISNATTVKTALQELETAFEESDANSDSLITLSGVSENSTSLGSFTGHTIQTGRNIKQALQDLETHADEVDDNVNDLITLSGVSENSSTLGTFSGSTINSYTNIKGALQQLETEVETKQDIVTGGNGVDLTGTTLSVDLLQTTATNNVKVLPDDNSDYYDGGAGAFSALTFDWDIFGYGVIDVDSTTLTYNVGAVGGSGSESAKDAIYYREDPNNSGEFQLIGRYRVGGSTFGWYAFSGLNATPVGTSGGSDFSTGSTITASLLANWTNSNAVDGNYYLPLSLDIVQEVETLTTSSSKKIFFRDRTDSGTKDEWDSPSSFDFVKLNINGHVDFGSDSKIVLDTTGSSAYGVFSKEHTDGTYTILARYGLGGSWYVFSGITSDPSNLNGTDGETIHTYSNDTERTDKRHIIATSTQTINSVNFPSDSFDVFIDTSTTDASFLEFSSGKIAVSVKDEDNMASDSADHVPTQQSVKAYVDANETHIDNIMTLLGETKDDTDLGNFTGSTISDGSTVRAALQDLETAVDNALGGGAAAASVDVVTRSTDATHYLTFVTDDNSSATQENIYTDAGISYNPSTNILTAGEIVVSGNLTVNGSQTVIDSTTLNVEDKNITLGNTGTPTDTTADGGGFTLKGTTDKTFNWVNSTDSFTASENIDLASGKTYKINNADVLSSTTLGSTVVSSSLTSVGTLSSVTVSGDTDLNGVVYIDQSKLRIGAVAVTATAAELNRLDGASTSGVVGGKAVLATSLKDIVGIRNLETDGTVTVGTNLDVDGITTLDNTSIDGTLTHNSVALSATFTELNLMSGITAIKDEDDLSSDSATSLVTQQSVKAYVDTTTGANETHIDNLVTVSGVAKDATHLGTFTGSTIADSRTVKEALQDLETQLEADNPILIEIHNDQGAQIQRGDAVYITGFHDSDGTPKVKLADANGAGTHPAIGVVQDATISDGDHGYVILGGVLSGIDTDTPGWDSGTILYLSETAGDLTSTRPTASGSVVQQLGVVMYRHVSAGVVLVLGAGRVNDIQNEVLTTLGISHGDANLGTFSGSTIADNQSIKSALQALETKAEANTTAITSNDTDISTINATVTEIDGNANSLIALSGVAENAENLGSFGGGTIIADNATIKEALEDLDNELSNITLTNLNIDGATSGTIADASLFVIDEGADGTNKKVTASALATYVAGEKTIKDLASVGTTADSEPTNYYFLAVDASTGDIVILNKQFVETEGSP